MATSDLSSYNKELIPDASTMRIGIVVSEWNSDITENLLRGCMDALIDCGANTDKIQIIHVPGSFELAQGAAMLFANRSVEAAICLGCIIRGETPHFEFVSIACAQGIQEAGLRAGKPCIFGVLTDDNIQQSRDRSGGSKGNKGTEAAITAIKMIALKRDLEDNW